MIGHLAISAAVVSSCLTAPLVAANWRDARAEDEGPGADAPRLGDKPEDSRSTIDGTVGSVNCSEMGLGASATCLAMWWPTRLEGRLESIDCPGDEAQTGGIDVALRAIRFDPMLPRCGTDRCS